MAITANNQKTTQHSTSSHSASPIFVASGADSITETTGRRKRTKSENLATYQVIGSDSDDQTKEHTKKPARKKPRKTVAQLITPLHTRTSASGSVDLEDTEDKGDEAKQANDKDEAEDIHSQSKRRQNGRPRSTHVLEIQPYRHEMDENISTSHVWQPLAPTEIKTEYDGTWTRLMQNPLKALRSISINVVLAF